MSPLCAGDDTKGHAALVTKVSPDWICAVTSRFTKLFYCERLNIAHI